VSAVAYRTLGRSGLVVSPFSLGTMTFGAPGWGTSEAKSAEMLDTYIAAGGNFIDTADVYSDGASEEIIGRYIADRKLRDSLVVATKSTWHVEESRNPNAGGNGRKHMYRALHDSLRRLQTDYIDLYYVHAYDAVTPVEETLQTLGDLVRAGKIRYFGFSNVPAWYVAKAATLASAHATAGPIALQLSYSLIERTIEHEHVPLSLEAGLGICAWSPLAFGFLTGKYQRDGAKIVGAGRLDSDEGGNTNFLPITDAHWKTLDALRTVAAQHERSLAQVALAWALARPGLTALILGASKVEQLQDNLNSASLQLTPDQIELLEADTLAPPYPYGIFSGAINRGIFGGNAVRGWR